MENKDQSDEIYRRIDCTIVVIEKNICKNCDKLKKILKQIQQRISTGINSTKMVHASKEILINKVNKQQTIIKKQKKLINNLNEHLNKRIEKEEVEVSNEFANIIYNVSEKVINKKIDSSNLHPIFQELIRIQTGKSKGTRYHPM
jgi:lysyl-tRNA synthetase class I